MHIKMSEIEKFFPDYLQKGAFHEYMLKEYFHYHMLHVIYNSKYAKYLYFLGGTCLRIIHGFQRFSEDLDFDCFQYTKQNHLDLCNIIVAEFQKFGIHVEIEPIREEKLKRLKAFQSTLNFPQLLQRLNLSGHEEEKFKIKIEAQSHNFQYEPESKIIQKFDVFTPIFKMPDETLLSSKICAAVQRQKGRDFMDVVNLLAFVKPDYDYLQEKLNVHSSAALKKLLLEKTESVPFESKIKDCRHLVWDDSELNKVKFFRQYINEIEF